MHVEQSFHFTHLYTGFLTTWFSILKHEQNGHVLFYTYFVHTFVKTRINRHLLASSDFELFIGISIN